MTRRHLWVPVILVLFGVTMTFAQETDKAFHALSAWTNQRGSTLYIQGIDPSGLVSGYYVNRAQGYGCQDTPYMATGWVYGTAITFSVKWENAAESCHSMTSWTGFYAQGVITTRWQLIRDGVTNKDHMIQGEDIFRPVQQKQSKSPRGE